MQKLCSFITVSVDTSASLTVTLVCTFLLLYPFMNHNRYLYTGCCRNCTLKGLFFFETLISEVITWKVVLNKNRSTVFLKRYQSIDHDPIVPILSQKFASVKIQCNWLRNGVCFICKEWKWMQVKLNEWNIIKPCGLLCPYGWVLPA